MDDEDCQSCGGETVIRPVPTACRELLSGDPATIRVCERCLSVDPVSATPVTRDWDPRTVSDALPSDPAGAVAMAMLVTLLDSLALHRSAVTTLTAALETEWGVDPLLALDRIAADSAIDPGVDLTRRRHQVAQLRD